MRLVKAQLIVDHNAICGHGIWVDFSRYKSGKCARFCHVQVELSHAIF